MDKTPPADTPAAAPAPGKIAPTAGAAFDVQVGMTVLLCLDRPALDAPPTLRPFIVTYHDGAKIDGLLVYWGESDRQTAWCLRNAKLLPAVETPCRWVRAVHYGHAVGEWRYQGDLR